jgi:hypothetical protein
MDQSTARQSAIAAITSWPTSNGHRPLPKDTSIRQFFGINVFSR